MKTVITIDPLSDIRWNDFVNRNKHATIFHHPAWLRMLNQVYGYRAFAVCLLYDDRIAAGIPFMDVRSVITGDRWISVPFSDHCQPLIELGQQDNLGLVMEFLRARHGSETPRIEIRWHADVDFPAHRDKSFVLHSLQLDPDVDAVFKTFKKTQVQQPIVKALREGVEVTECCTLQEFEVFYDLQVRTRQRLGVPAQPRGFFVSVWKEIIAAGYGFVLLARLNSTPIGGGVFFSFGETMTYKYAASDYTYKAFKPNDVILWEAIQRACRGGFKSFDFGRSERSNEGLRKFKSGWGTEERDLDYTIVSSLPPKSSNVRLDALAGSVIRNSPRFVCRLAGELLYKHFA